MKPPFSARTRWDFSGDRLGEALRLRRLFGRPLVDLSESNPTRVGLSPPASLLEALSNPEALDYAPEPFGHPRARAAVARHCGVEAERVVLSASTSEAYAMLFRLLCDPGDRVLVPVPSYPLFELLASLESVEVQTYETDPFDGFALDAERIEAALDARTRAIVVVSPNNPTGRVLRKEELRALGELCVRRGLALIVDEVFSEWTTCEDPDAVKSAAGFDGCLSFVLGGLSKSLLLPQMKVGWSLVGGPGELVEEALSRLEIVADAALSVATPQQLALEHWLLLGEALRAPLKARLARNRRTLAEVVRGSATSLWKSDGGWQALLRVPRTRKELDWAVALVEEEGILVSPGFHFDFPSEGWLVLSLLLEEDVFEEAARRLVRFIDAHAGGC